MLLEEALEQKCARVNEVSQSGSVPELKFTNDCERPVLLMDGEELVGAKQNRILNLTVLAPAGKTIIIPVSCVEAGRWQARSAEFSVAGRAHFSRGRGITGGGLLHNDRLVHLCVFRIPGQRGGSGNTDNRITRASNRRRHWDH